VNAFSVRFRILSERKPTQDERSRGCWWVIAWNTDRAVIDRILAHRAKAGLASPFEARTGPSD